MNYATPLEMFVCSMIRLELITLWGNQTFTHCLSFHGARVNVTALPFAPFWEERKGPDNTIKYSGTDYFTLTAIAAALNFTVHVVPTSSWGEVRDE